MIYRFLYQSIARIGCFSMTMLINNIARLSFDKCHWHTRYALLKLNITRSLESHLKCQIGKLEIYVSLLATIASWPSFTVTQWKFVDSTRVSVNPCNPKTDFALCKKIIFFSASTEFCAKCHLMTISLSLSSMSNLLESINTDSNEDFSYACVTH